MSYHKIGKTSAQIPKKTWLSQQMEAFADMNQLDDAGDSSLHCVQQCGLYSALVPVVLA